MYLGTDPEFFIVRKSDKRPIPAHRFFGDKTEKKKVEGGFYYPSVITDRTTIVDRGGYPTNPSIPTPANLFRDGYALEVNIDPATCRGIVIANVVNALLAAEKFIGEDYEILADPTIDIDLGDLASAPIDVLSFGCDPAWNAYTLAEEVAPIDASSHPKRYAGGHLHFALDPVNSSKHPLVEKKNYPLMVKMLDYWVGLPLTFLTSDPKSFERRQFYGKAGEFRIQKYPAGPTTGVPCVGLEYRVLGNDVFRSHHLAQLAMGAARRVLQNFPDLEKKWNPKIEPKVREALNTGKDLESLLGSVPGFYTPEVLKVARQEFKKKFSSLTLYPHQPNPSVHSNMVYQNEGWTNTVLGNSALKRVVSWSPFELPRELPSLAA